MRETDEIDKNLNLYSVARVISSKENRLFVVEYKNFLRELEIVDHTKLRLFSRTCAFKNHVIKRVNLNDLLKQFTELNLTLFNKISFTDILTEIFSQKNNCLDNIAVESIKNDAYLLGEPEDLLVAYEVLMLKIHSIVEVLFTQISMNEKNLLIIQEKAKLEQINKILNCENKRTFKFTKKFANTIKVIL